MFIEKPLANAGHKPMDKECRSWVVTTPTKSWQRKGHLLLYWTVCWWICALLF